MPKILSTFEVSKILKCKPSWVRLLRKTGALKAIKVSPTSMPRFTEEEVRNFGLRSKDVPAYTEPIEVRNELFCLYYGVTDSQLKDIFQGKDPATIDRRLLWQRVRKAKGLCPICGKKAVPGRVHCRKCQTKRRNRQRVYIKKRKLDQKQTAKKTSPNNHGK